ncbi:phage tail length tape measure family protein [Candidatus Micrarchaeota archaeon]|nr:phage tail length tape measure family protein [Candidatus Micrarchaeota archaeon]
MALGNTANATIKINADTLQAATGIKKLNDTVKKLATGAGALLIFNKINGLLRESAELAKFQIQADQKLTAVLKSTGNAAGLTFNQLKNMASGLQSVTTFGDEAIQEAQSLLLTFTKIGKDVFPKATETVLDMSAALGQDLKSSAIQLGKALNDPINGSTALRRVGVSLTDQQLEQIKTLTKQNKLFEAQKIILDELQVEFGGMAKELAKTDVGKLEQMKNTLNDIKELLGKEILPFQLAWNKLILETVQGWQHILGLTAGGKFEKISKELVEQKKLETQWQ